MTITQRLYQHYSTDNVLHACSLLVKDIFPERGLVNRSRQLEDLARKAGIRIEREESRAFDGRYEANEDGASTITLTTMGSRTRSRFTLAHEIGHWLLRRSGSASGIVRESQGADREEERLADLLAAELLMPAEAIVPMLRYSRICEPLVNRIAKTFDVSFKAAFRRVADIGALDVLHFTIIPHRFSNPNSAAEIDSGYFAISLKGLQRYSGEFRFVRKYSFSDIVSGRQRMIGIVWNDGRRVLQRFDIKARERPVPNCDLFAAVVRRELMH